MPLSLASRVSGARAPVPLFVRTARRRLAQAARIALSAVLLSPFFFTSADAATVAQPSSPWEHAVTVLRTSFTGTIAKGLSLIAIVIGGLLFAFSEGGSKRVIAGIVFGVGMAIGANSFMNWLFP